MAQSVGAVALDIIMGKNTVSGVVRDAMREVQDVIGNASSTVGQKVSAIGGAVTSVGSAIMPASTAMIGLGGSCVKTAANFESAMSQVQAISGATGDDFDALKKKAQEMGAKTKFSASQSAEAMTYMAMAGWKTEDMLGGISGIMNLAAASGEDLATTSDIVTDALTAFGKSAKDSGELADIMAAASSNANTNVAMMGETFKYCAPVAGALGYTMQDTSLAIGLMANAGIKGSQAGTSLRSMFTRLSSPPKECADAMAQLGISITNADGTMKPFREVIGDLRTKFSGLSEAQQAQFAKSIAGQEAMSGLLAIVNAAPADVDKLTSAIDNSNGTAEKMADTMNNNLNGKLTLLKSQFEGLAIEIGNNLTPIIDVCISAISGLATWFGNLSDPMKKVVASVGLIIAALGPALIIIGKTISLVGSAISAVSAISGAISGFVGFISGTVIPALSGFFSFLMANPIILIIAGIIAVGVLLITHWKEVKKIAGEVWKWIGDTISSVAEFISGCLETAAEFWSGVISSVTEFISGCIETAVNFWRSVIETVFNAISAVISFAVNLWYTIISTVFNAIRTVITTIVNVIRTVITTVFNAIRTVITTVLNVIRTVVTTVFTAIKTVITTILNTIRTIVTTVWNGIRNTVTTVVNTVKTVVIGAWNAITSGISRAGTAIWNAVTGCFNKVKGFITGLAKEAFSWGSDMINGIAKGIKSAAGNVVDGVKGVGKKIKSFLHFSRPDEGPLRDYETWMPDFMHGMANGINSSKYKLIDAVKGVSREMAINEFAGATIQAPALKNAGNGYAQQQTGVGSDERLYGLLSQLIAKLDNTGDITVPVYLGNDIIDEQIIKASDRRTVRSGGRA